MNSIKRILIIGIVSYGLYFSYRVHKSMPHILRAIYFS